MLQLFGTVSHLCPAKLKIENNVQLLVCSFLEVNSRHQLASLKLALFPLYLQCLTMSVVFS